MDTLLLMTKSKIENLISKRPLESKFGEHVKVLSTNTNIYEDLKLLDVQYVLLGLPEDIGVLANHGKTGAYNAWDATIKVLLNTQNNTFNDANKVLILGCLDFTSELQKLSKWQEGTEKHIAKARKLVVEIDKIVCDAVYTIVKAGKIPMLIGGGHNNAYGNIKGTSLALNHKINAINFDAHSDFRALEGRHSGNGFSYAFAEGFLNNYFVFGLHENYTSEGLLETFKENKKLQYTTFEAIEIRKELSFKAEMKRAKKHIDKVEFGLEIDCDAIENIPSSAQTPSGFSTSRARQFVNYFGKQKQVAYLHICEAAPNTEQNHQVGKLITYLITDFIRANNYD
ncbi:formimidoylglutamase [Lacinutrix neustonica]|uniref:Formimidoylglutamase n=1 Tax=Lacinutrix neustonica TaxID=2980107 RepID=A0A9E8N0R1_9FLAO|nr:formimidoylglutamase [Lacinutrix neustonica]WAC03957.1 formimidoylglutamase [Lacinutrix neustonica]